MWIAISVELGLGDHVRRAEQMAADAHLREALRLIHCSRSVRPAARAA